MSDVVSWFSGIAPEWALFFLSMIPITELRAAIPIGIEVYHFSILKTWIITVLGNTAPTVLILLLFPKLHDIVIKCDLFGRTIRKILERAERKLSGNYAKYGALGLIIFIGIPLPFTGAWTGSLAAFIFRIPFKKAFPLVFAGICLSATIVTLITVFAGNTLRWFIS